MKVRAISLFTAVTLIFCIAAGRVYYIIDSADCTAASEQMTYVLTIDKPRGNIYDCNLRKLVGTQSRYTAAVSPNVSAVNEITKRLGSGAKPALELLRAGKPAAIEVTADFDAEESVLFTTSVRYSAVQTASHLIGYTDASGHGVTGIESAYDDFLTCEDAVTVTYTVDATGRPLSGVEPVVSGSTDIKTGVILTVDSTVQRAAEQAAQSLGTGAVIVMDADDGDIRAICSVPDYSPLNIAAALESSTSPLVNRALSPYDVGSVFKILVAAAAIYGGVSPSHRYTCTGNIKIGTNVFNCHDLDGHGSINMTDALCGSCNPYFITLARLCGADKLFKLCRSLSLGSERSLADGLVSAAGTLPDEQTVKDQPAALANFAFGQGKLLLTPVDVAVMTAMTANGGYAVTPRVVSGVMLTDGSVTELKHQAPQRVISEYAASQVSRMMQAVISDGTGAAAMPETGGAGGKTATARAGYTVGGEKVDQCWFSGFYPAKDPQYVITVFGENGVSGASTCAPVFKAICDALAKM